MYTTLHINTQIYMFIFMNAVNRKHVHDSVQYSYSKGAGKEAGMTSKQFAELPRTKQLELFERYKKAASCANS